MIRTLLNTRWFRHGLICIALSLGVHFSAVLAMSWRYIASPTNVAGESIVIELRLSQDDPPEPVEAQVAFLSPPATAIAQVETQQDGSASSADPAQSEPVVAAAPEKQTGVKWEPEVEPVELATRTNAIAKQGPQKSNQPVESTAADRPQVDRISLIEVMAATRQPKVAPREPQAAISLASFAIPDDAPRPGAMPRRETETGQRLAKGNSSEQPETDIRDTEPQAEFFGVQANGKRFAFVVDCSISMTGGKWIQARQELIRSLQRLNEHQYFYVVFFDAKTHAMPLFAEGKQQDGMMAATAANVKRLQEWMRNVRLGADTRPYWAVRSAFACEPDAMFFLSDGAFADQTLCFLRDTNQLDDGTVTLPVHTVSFERGRGAILLKRMADENGGKFQPVWR